jgi:hypothetical protein
MVADILLSLPFVSLLGGFVGVGSSVGGAFIEALVALEISGCQCMYGLRLTDLLNADDKFNSSFRVALL